MKGKRKGRGRKTKAQSKKQKAIGLVYENEFNVSNTVPVQQVLRMKLHDSFPILYLAEFCRRRFDFLAKENELFHHYDEFTRDFRKGTHTKEEQHCNVIHESDYSDAQKQKYSRKEILNVLARVIVVPLDYDLISKVAYPKVSHSYDVMDNVQEDKDGPMKESAFNGIQNCYKVNKKKRKRNEISQSLEAIVDAVISKLVTEKKKYTNKLSNEYMYKCFGKNILSEGYRLCPMSSPRKKRHIGRNQNSVAQLLDTPTSLQCQTINSCASFARTSPEMKFLQGIIGDDGIREILLKCMIFFPVKTAKGESFFRGNYVQICGPYLNFMSLKARPKQPNMTLFKTNHEKNKPQGRIEIPASKLIKGSEKSSDDNVWIVPRYRMFYADSFQKKIGLPPKHVLNCQSDFNVRKNILLVDIIGYTGKRTKKPSKIWKRVAREGLKLSEQILRRHKKCDYHRLLDKYCPVPSNEIESQNIDSLLSLDAKVPNIISFFKSAISKVFPIEFFGSYNNLDAFLDTVVLLVSKRKREELNIREIMRGVRILHMKWLFQNESTKKRSPVDHQTALALAVNVFKWLHSKYLVPLIRSCFYCTDTEYTKDSLVYFRKPVWAKISKITMSSLQKKQFKRVDTVTRDNLLRQSTLGFSALRLLPKSNGGMRPIALLCKKEKVTDFDVTQNTKSTNEFLREAFQVLSYEDGRAPSLFGVGVKGFHEVHARLLQCTKLIKQGKQLYFASVDIHKCYDNINQRHLLQLIQSIFSKEEYALQKYFVVHPFENGQNVKQKEVRLCGAPGSIMNVTEQTRKISENFSGAVICDGVDCQVSQREDLMKLITEHLERNLILGKDVGTPYLMQQMIGIPQGSIMSSMLCNFYYGDIESEMLGNIFDQFRAQEFNLIRVVDDFLLVTENKDLLLRFLTDMSQGMPNLGVVINSEKTKTSCTCTLAENEVLEKDVICMNGSSFFRWCGLLIDTRTLNVRIDYGRFIGSIPKNKLNVSKSRKDGATLLTKLKWFVRPRCTPVLFDSRINSSSTIAINFHQAIMFCAIKSIHYLNDFDPDHNEKFLRNCISNTILFAYNHIYSNLRKETKQGGPDNEAVFANMIDEEAALWLGFQAYRLVFQRSRRPVFVRRSKELMQNVQWSRQGTNLELNTIVEQSVKSFHLEKFHL